MATKKRCCILLDSSGFLMFWAASYGRRESLLGRKSLAARLDACKIRGMGGWSLAGVVKKESSTNLPWFCLKNMYVSKWAKVDLHLEHRGFLFKGRISGLASDVSSLHLERYPKKHQCGPGSRVQQKNSQLNYLFLLDLPYSPKDPCFTWCNKIFQPSHFAVLFIDWATKQKPINIMKYLQIHNKTQQTTGKILELKTCFKQHQNLPSCFGTCFFEPVRFFCFYCANGGNATEDNYDWSMVLELLKLLGREHVMGVAIGNEMDT